MRAFDATIHDRIANHPDVIRKLEWNPDQGPMSFADLAADSEHFVLLHNPTDDLGLIFEWSAPGVWQVHTMSLPSIRGNAVEDAKALLHEMFVLHGADMIWGQTPLHNVAARKFNTKIGAVPCGESVHHIAGPVEYFRNSRARWLADHWNFDQRLI